MKKGYGVKSLPSHVDSYEPQSEMRLEHAEAKAHKGQPIGKKVKMTVHATKIAHRIEPSSQKHSATYHIHKVEPVSEHSKGSKGDEMAND